MATTHSKLKTLHHPPPPPSSATLTTMKLKTLFQTFIFSHMYRIARALTKAKSSLVHLLKNTLFTHSLAISLRKNKQQKLFFGSFRLHYNWCSSHDHQRGRVYYQSWNSVVNPRASFDSCNENIKQESSNDDESNYNELSKYLQWLEDQQKGCDDISSAAINENIDELADLFIANCHEKFRLEKVESYRRFQEMMARSV